MAHLFDVPVCIFFVSIQPKFLDVLGVLYKDS